MRRIVSALVLLVALSACATTVTPAVQKQPAREPLIAVHFQSRPDHAELYIDGKLVGSTDMTYRLTPGMHTIEIKREGYESWRRELSVSADNPAKLSATLVKS